MSEQLVLCGGGPVLAVADTRRLSGVQRAILRHVGEHGSIRSVEAGVFAHAGRRPDHSYGYSGLGCCQYAAKDGLESCKRLLERGLLRRDVPGVWTAA